MKGRVLICILIHLKPKNFKYLQRIKLNKNDQLLIIFDKINLKFDKKKFKNVKVIKGNKKNNPVPYYRNLAIKYAKKKFENVLFIDSDTVPTKDIVNKHYNAHKKFKSIPLIGGAVKPSYSLKYKSVWEFFDGICSWFTSIEPKNDRIISKPYHLPTCNLSIKTNYLKKHKIYFDEKLRTGEDVDLCNKFRSKNLKLMLIKNASIIHQDRIGFIEFLNHQLEWGKHHYYLRYKKLIFKDNKFLLFLFFLFVYPFIFPFFNFVMTYYTIVPWIKKNFLFSLNFVPIYMVYFIKSLSTYMEFLRDLIKVR